MNIITKLLIISLTLVCVSVNAVDINVKNNSVYLKGEIVTGDAEKLDFALENFVDMSKDSAIWLSSGGGLIREGRLMAEIVSMRGFNTIVEDHCESACSFIFFSGKNYNIYNNGKVGLHTPYNMLGDDKTHSREWWYNYSNLILSVMDEVLAKKIITRMYATPSDRMFFIYGNNIGDWGGIHVGNQDKDNIILDIVYGDWNIESYINSDGYYIMSSSSRNNESIVVIDCNSISLRTIQAPIDDNGLTYISSIGEYLVYDINGYQSDPEHWKSVYHMSIGGIEFSTVGFTKAYNELQKTCSY